MVEHRALIPAEDLVDPHEYVYVVNDRAPEEVSRQKSRGMPLPDGGLSPGRHLCILHMSLLI